MRVCAPVIAILLMAIPAQGSQVYTDRTSFEASLASFIIEDFESTALVGSADGGATASVSLSDFSLSAAVKSTGANAVKVLDTVIFGTGNTTPGGERYVYIDSDLSSQGTLTTISFFSGIQAIGFDYSGLSQSGAEPTITIGDEEFSLDLNPWPPAKPNVVESLFWGFTADAPFSTLVIDSGIDSAYGIDQVTYSSVPSVPEPGTAILLALGLGLLASRASTRRAG